MAGFDLTALAAALGAYSRENTAQVLRQKINMGMAGEPEAPLTAFEIFAKRYFRDEQAFARTNITLQAREKSTNVAEQPATPISIEGDLRKLRDIQTVMSFAPDDLENTWLDQTTLFSSPSKFKQQPDLADMEFVPWLIQHMVDLFTSKIIEETVFPGVYTPGYGYADSFPKAFDGVLQIVTAAIAAGDISNVVATGPITVANAFDKLEDIGKAVPYNLRGEDLFMLVPELVHDLYNEHRSAKYPGENASLHPQYKVYKLRNRSRISLIPVTQMGASQRVVLTTRENISFNHDFRGDGPQLKFAVKDVENIQMSITHSAGMSVDRYDEIVTNDQV